MNPVFQYAANFFSSLLLNTAIFINVSKITGIEPKKWKSYGLTFIINYLLFLACTFANLFLFFDWIMAGVIFVAEVHIIYKTPFKQSFFLGLSAAFVGLACSIFTRSLTSLITGIPLAAFDAGAKGTTVFGQEAVKVKEYAVSGGFFLTGAGILCIKKEDRFLLMDKDGIDFMNKLLSALFVFLIINLFVYSVPLNNSVLKIWEIKVAICAFVGYVLGVSYTISTVKLKLAKEEGEQVKETLEQHKNDAENYEKMAYTDAMTDCLNRIAGEGELDALIAEKEEDFYVVFMDLDNLKIINDNLGHSIGDCYLKEAVRIIRESIDDEENILCRFGGDEFLAIITKCDDVKRIEKHLEKVEKEMEKDRYFKVFQASIGISYGIVKGNDYASKEALLKAADEQMYRCKKEHKQRRAKK